MLLLLAIKDSTVIAFVDERINSSSSKVILTEFHDNLSIVL